VRPLRQITAPRTSTRSSSPMCASRTRTSSVRSTAAGADDDHARQRENAHRSSQSMVTFDDIVAFAVIRAWRATDDPPGARAPALVRRDHQVPRATARRAPRRGASSPARELGHQARGVRAARASRQSRDEHRGASGMLWEASAYSAGSGRTSSSGSGCRASVVAPIRSSATRSARRCSSSPGAESRQGHPFKDVPK
jgi:hypothetical protein